MKKWIVSLHRWVGLLVGLLFSFLMLTGFVLTAVEQAEERWIIDQPWIEKSTEELGDDLAILLANQPDTLYGTVYMPTPIQPAYGVPKPVYTPEEAARMLGGIQDRVRSPVTDYYTLGDLELIWSFDRTEESQLFQLISDLHVSLVDGTDLTAWIGYAGAVLCLIGIYLWWSWRRGFRLSRVAWPRSAAAMDLDANHTSGGIVAVLFLVVLGLSGAILAQRGTMLDGIGALEGDRAEMARVPQLSVRGEQWRSWPELLEIAHASMSGATLASISIPRGSEVLDFRFRAAGDLSQFGASHVYLNPYSGAVESAYDVRDASTLRWLFSQLRPIHTGENMPAWYVVLIGIGSIVGAVVTATGVLAMMRRLFRSPGTHR